MLLYTAWRGKSSSRRLSMQLGRKFEHYTLTHHQPLAPHFRPIVAVPLEHRLKWSLQAAEHWLSTIAHQVKVTKHNWSVLLRQHLPISCHLRAMRRVARCQAKERLQPTSNSNSRSRAIQAEVKSMKAKLYAKKKVVKKVKSQSKVGHPKQRWVSKTQLLQGQQLLSFSGPSLRHHPPWPHIFFTYESSCRQREAQSSMRQTDVWGCVKFSFYFIVVSWEV